MVARIIYRTDNLPCYYGNLQRKSAIYFVVKILQDFRTPFFPPDIGRINRLTIIQFQGIG